MCLLRQIMFRGGVVGELDARRDAALARVLVRLQARARGLLARRRAQRLRTQHTAARYSYTLFIGIISDMTELVLSHELSHACTFNYH